MGGVRAGDVSSGAALSERKRLINLPSDDTAFDEWFDNEFAPNPPLDILRTYNREAMRIAWETSERRALPLLGDAAKTEFFELVDDAINHVGVAGDTCCPVCRLLNRLKAMRGKAVSA